MVRRGRLGWDVGNVGEGYQRVEEIRTEQEPSLDGRKTIGTDIRDVEFSWPVGNTQKAPAREIELAMKRMKVKEK